MRKIINQELMKNTNKKQVFKCIKENYGVSKRNIADKLGLSTTTVATCINELLTDHKIRSCGSAKSTGGRKSVLYELEPDAGYAIGIDLQVDRLVFVLLNYAGTLISTKEIALNSKNEWTVASILNHSIQEFIEEHRIPTNKILGIGLGIPGIVNGQSGLINFAPNFGWRNVNLQSLIKINSAIVIENEANAAALGEKTFGAGRNVSNMVYVSVGMGVGCGIIIENRLFSGRSFNAGEFGHMTVEQEGKLCKCGKRGCWEVYASNNAALDLYGERSGAEIERFEEFVERVLVKEKIAIEVMNCVVKYLGIGIGNIVNGLNPEMIVIGGKIADARDQLYDPLLKQVKDSSLEESFLELQLRFSSLNNKAPAMGVAAIVLEKALDEL